MIWIIAWAISGGYIDGLIWRQIGIAENQLPFEVTRRDGFSAQNRARQITAVGALPDNQFLGAQADAPYDFYVRAETQQ